MLKHDSATPTGGPDHPTALLGAAEQQLKSLGQLDLQI
jgi:hypothetical protein